MKTVVVALIVALAIVFHAIAPEVFREAAPPTEIDGWVESVSALVCARHIVFREYMTSSMGNFWADHDDARSRLKTGEMIRERALQYRNCEELVPGQIVSWIPGAPVSLERLPEDAIQHYRNLGALENIHRVALVKYTSEDGVEKRGYTSRSWLRSLDEADEPSE